MSISMEKYFENIEEHFNWITWENWKRICIQITNLSICKQEFILETEDGISGLLDIQNIENNDDTALEMFQQMWVDENFIKDTCFRICLYTPLWELMYSLGKQEKSVIVYIASGYKTDNRTEFQADYKIITYSNKKITVKIGDDFVCNQDSADNEVEFSQWFDEVYSGKNSDYTEKENKAIGTLIRFPGGKHEWLKVSQREKIKKLGIPGEYIRKYTTPTLQCRFWSQELGRVCIHGGASSTSMHLDLDWAYDNAENVLELIENLQKLNETYRFSEYNKEFSQLLNALQTLRKVLREGERDEVRCI